MTSQKHHKNGIAGDVVTFRIADEVLAVRASLLREVLEPAAITRVPGAPKFVAGLLNVRGAVVPLADLRVPLRMPQAPMGPDSRILVLELSMDGQAAVVGIIADAVHEVTHIEDAALQNIPAVGTRWPPRYVAAVGRWMGEFVTIPDLDAVLSDFFASQIGRTPASLATGTPPVTQTETA